MTSMVLGDSTLESLTPNVNAPLETLIIISKTNNSCKRPLVGVGAHR
jgi:hypothetical protein